MIIFLNVCDTGVQNPSYVIFLIQIIFYSASASKYLLQIQNTLFLNEVILVWLEQSKS